MKQKRKRLWAVLLSAALVVTQLPAVAMAETAAPEDGAIRSFAKLDSHVKTQSVPVGTLESELDLPDELTAEVYHVTEDMVTPDEDVEDDDATTASPSDAESTVSDNNAEGKEETTTTVTISTEQIPVTWESSPAYDGDTEGRYVFTADVEGYVLSDGVEPPQITVTVTGADVENPAETQPEKPDPCTRTEGCTLPDGHGGDCETEQLDHALLLTITNWTFVDDENLNEGKLPLITVSKNNQADYETVVSMLPTQIRAELQGEEEQAVIDIVDWLCPEYQKSENGDWPLTGEYLFTAVMPEGYVLDEGVQETVVPVLLGGGATLAGDTGDFTVSGGTLNTDYSYADNILTIKNGANLTISGTTTKDKIVVENGGTAYLTLDGVHIKRTNADTGGSALDAAGATLYLTLRGNNSLETADYYAAALHVPERATLEITGRENDKLTVNSNGNYGTAIGGSGKNVNEGNGENSGDIVISGGDITANSSGTGIGGGCAHGGGNGGNGGTITITNSTVNVNNNGYGAGIGGGGGGGSGGSGGTITIINSEVNATSTNGAGIGGGIGNTGGIGGSVIIEGGTVTAKSNTGKDIGSGKSFNGTAIGGGSLSVSDGATIKLNGTGTNATTEYKNCTVTNKDGNSTKYNNEGKQIVSPTLSLTADPASSLTLPGSVTLTATLSGADPSISGKPIVFAVNGKNHKTVNTDTNGKAVCGIDNLISGTYTFGASFAGDATNEPAAATGISSYKVGLGTQTALTLKGLGNAYTYGDGQFNLSISGGSGGGAVSYSSSAPSVASVAGNTVTILKAGTFTITATKAADSNYAEAKVISSPVEVAEATPRIELSATGGANTTDPIILTATVSKTGTGTTPAGKVTFSEGSAVLAEVALDGSGSASYTVSNPTAGSHPYTAVYSGQTGYYKENSASHTVGVGLTEQTNFVITDPGVKTYGDREFTLAATGGESTGGVSFSVPADNGILAVKADGTATITGAGRVTVTAQKAADSTYNQATATREITVKPRDISNVTVNVTGSRVYAGSQLQPGFEVTDGAINITAGDYTNSYDANLDAGTDAGGITLTGQGNYTGTKTVRFDIEKRPLTGAAITLEAGPYTASGNGARPAVTGVEVDGIAVPSTAYDVEYTDNTKVGTAKVTITAKADGNFSGTAETTFEITSSGGSSSGGDSSSSGSSSSTPAAPKDSYKITGDRINQTVSRSDLQRLVDSSKNLTLVCDKASMTFGPAALKAILAAAPATAGSITFTAAPADLRAFPDAAALLGSHPAYDFAISYKDNKGNTVPVKVDFPAGSASIALNSMPAASEVAGSLFMVYVDGSGAVTWLDKSSYNSGRVLADVPHFSVYGVAYKAPAPVFTDITGHWAKADIEFVAARGLLSGTGNGTFSPDVTMTRGMFVTALGRLAGVKPEAYTARSFTDVKADAYYAPYIEWAAQKNLVKGTGEGLFSPDTPVTREQMAVIMANYAGQMGYSIPAPLAEEAFTDSSQISPWAVKEVTAMQRAGIIKGKAGNQFDPQAGATRAEVSAVLRRFVELVIDPTTAQGWTQNDSGQWLYNENGKPVTGWKQLGGQWYYFDPTGLMQHGGWKQINGKWYYFHTDGSMAANTKIDDYEVGADGARIS